VNIGASAPPSGEGAEDTAHDFDHLVRVMAIADSIQTIEGGDLLN